MNTHQEKFIVLLCTMMLLLILFENQYQYLFRFISPSAQNLVEIQTIPITNREAMSWEFELLEKIIVQWIPDETGVVTKLIELQYELLTPSPTKSNLTQRISTATPKVELIVIIPTVTNTPITLIPIPTPTPLPTNTSIDTFVAINTTTPFITLTNTSFPKNTPFPTNTPSPTFTLTKKPLLVPTSTIAHTPTKMSVNISTPTWTPISTVALTNTPITLIPAIGNIPIVANTFTPTFINTPPPTNTPLPFVWNETFDELGDGTIIDNGETAWTAEVSNSTVSVLNGDFYFLDTNNQWSSLTTEILELSNPKLLTISWSSFGDHENNEKLQIIVNENQIFEQVGLKDGNINHLLNPGTIVIQLRAINGGDGHRGERYIIHQIKVN